jgi:cardiolipin synthase
MSVLNIRWKRLWRRARALMRWAFGRYDSPARVARGVAAGSFAAAFPLPGLQIPLSLLFAWIARGNKLAAVLPQFLSNAATMLPLAFVEFRVGAWLWPAKSSDVANALAQVKQALDAWAWSAPLHSCRELALCCGQMGWDVLGPLALGVLALGAAAALLSFPLTLFIVWAWRRRMARLHPARYGGRAAPPLPVGDAGPAPEFTAALQRYGPVPLEVCCADSVKLLIDGRGAYPEMLDAIAAARAGVDMETYILRDDRTGRSFQRALIAAAARGARVRLLYDYIGAFGLPHDYVQELLDAGVAVSVYRPLVFGQSVMALQRRDHRKILIVDRAVSFTGGLNISHVHAPREAGGQDWRDTHARLDGVESAARMTALFDYGWDKAVPYARTRTRRARLASAVRSALDRPLGFMTRRAAPPAACPAGGVAVAVLGNQEFRYRQRIRRAYLSAIHNARRYILIENGYFIPDLGVRRALATAVRRGVCVAVLVADRSDVPLADYAGRGLFSELLRSGVRIYRWPHSMLHAKTAVVDDIWSVVGTYNLDHRSLRHQLENVVVVIDRDFARRLRDQTLADISRSRPVTLPEHESRPLKDMFLESGAGLLRYWL